MNGEAQPASTQTLATFAVALAALLLWAAAVPLAVRNDGDILHLWAAGRAFVEGHGLYDPVAHRAALAVAVGEVDASIWLPRNDQLGAFFYPPPAMAPYALLGLLPLRTATLLMALINLVAAVVGGVLMARPAGLARPAAVALVLLLPSAFFSFALGQNGLWTLLLLVAGGALCARGRPVVGGVALGLLLAKPSWLVATCWLPLLVGGWPALLGLLGGALATAGLGLLIGGVDAWRQWLELAPALSALSRLPDYPLHLQYNLASLVRRLLPAEQADLLALCLAIIVIGLTLVLVRRQRGRPGYDTWAWAGGLCAATLINPHIHHYDMLAVLPAALLLVGGARAPWRAATWLLVSAHYAAPLLTQVLQLERHLPLPTVTTLLIWLATVGGRPRDLQAMVGRTGGG